MEKEDWIENIMNSTTGIIKVVPNDDLFLKIENKITNQNKVSAKTVWLVAASIAILLMLNITVIKLKRNQKSTQEIYLEESLNRSHQLY